MKLSLLQRFEAKYQPEPNTGCWLWTGALSRGYGQIWDRDSGRGEWAHRVAYRLFNGPISSGLFVMHKCDVPVCVNPRHLSLGTQRDNILDAKQKHRMAHGASHIRAKLNESDIPAIRLAIKQGRPICMIARDYAIARAAIRRIADGETWKHVR